MISKSSLPFVFFLLLVAGAFGQEQICIPNVWKGEVVKGWIYLSNGDSLIGKFTHLTPKNDIKTTHVLYKGDGKNQTNVG